MRGHGPDISDETGGASPDVEYQPPDEVFGMLASDVRMSILLALGNPPGRTMTFSELYEATEVDDSGNFSYHLNELVGTFVRKETDGYQLMHAGEQVFGAVHAGTHRAKATVPATRFGGTCQLCGSSLLFEYRDEFVRVFCSECEAGRTFPFPPGIVPEYAIEDLPGVSARWFRTQIQRTVDGFCSVCAGPIEGELTGGVRPDQTPPQPSMAAFECRKCGKTVRVSVATIVTFHPVVEGFLFEHGFDTRTAPHSEVWDALDRTAEMVCSRKPLAIEVMFGHESERITAVVDSTASVASVERRRNDDRS